jgi:uncharacterized membrane protein YsdA (DUF1294 family)
MSRRRLAPDVPFLLAWIVGAAVLTAVSAKYVEARWYALAFAAVNVSTFALYGLDKLLAAADSRRVPERTLHLAAFLFGSPGALVAMRVFRHKTKKTSFQLVLALLVLVQMIVINYLIYVL